MSYIAFVIVWAICLIVALKKRRTADILNPVVWLILAWSFLLGSYLFSGITYEHDITILGWLYMASFFVVFFVTYSLVNKRYCPRDNFLRYHDEDFEGNIVVTENIISVKKYVIIGTSGVALYLFDFIRLNSLSNLYVLHDSFQMSIIGGVGLFLLCANSFVWLYQITISIRANEKIPMYSYVAAITQLIPYYLISGRQGMVLVGLELVMLFGFNMGENPDYKYKKSIYIFAIIAIVAIALYFVDVSTNRSTVSAMDLRFVSLETVDGVHFSDNAKKLIYAVGSFGPALMTIMYYFSHQFRSFQVFLDCYRFWPLCGAYEFHYIARRLGPLDLSDYAYVAFEKMQNASGLNYHVYRTAIAAFIVDFGWIGAYIFLIFLTSLIAKRYKAFKTFNSAMDVVFQIIICTGIFFTIEYSPFSEQLWAYSFFWVLLVPSIEYSIANRKIALIKTL